MDQLGFFMQILDSVQRTLLPAVATLRHQMVFWFGLFLLLDLVALTYAVVFNGRRIAGIAGLLFKGGLLWWLLYNFQDFVEGVIMLFARLGLTAGGQHVALTQFLDPGQYLKLALEAAEPLIQAAANTSWMSMLSTGLLYQGLALALLGAFAVMALHIFIWQMEMLIAEVMLLVLIPTLCFRATQWVGQSLLALIMNLALKFGLGALLVSLTLPLVGKLSSMPGGAMITIRQAVLTVVGGWAFAVLFFAVNRLASGLASGIPQLTGGLLVGAAAGSAALVGAVVSGGTSLGLGTVTGGARVTQLGMGTVGAVQGLMTRGPGTPLLAAARTGATQSLASPLAQRLSRIGTTTGGWATGHAQRSLRQFADVTRYVGQDHGGHGFRH